MSQVEGKLVMGTGNVVRHNATYYEEVVSTDASWTEVVFVDHNDEPFVSEHMLIHMESANSAEFSFDQKDHGGHPRVVQGVLGDGVAHKEIMLNYKRASSVFIRRATSNVTVRVYAWR